MPVSNYALVMDVLRHYRRAMQKFVEQTLRRRFSDDWWNLGVRRHFKAEELSNLERLLAQQPKASSIEIPVRELPDMLDVAQCRKVIEGNWRSVFEPILRDRKILDRWIADVTDSRNFLAHWAGDDIGRQDALSFAYTCRRIVQSFDPKAAQAIQELWHEIDERGTNWLPPKEGRSVRRRPRTAKQGDQDVAEVIIAQLGSDVSNEYGRHPAEYYDRLRRAPSRYSVPSSLPVLFFGNLDTARVATVGLNPSFNEYIDGQGGPLRLGDKKRFESLHSLGAASRAQLNVEQCDRAIAMMEEYFLPGRKIWGGYFNRMNRVATGMGHRLYPEDGVSGAAHLDLVQEATDPNWSDLEKKDWDESAALRDADLRFLKWQVGRFPLTAILCDGASVWRQMRALFAVDVVVENETRSFAPSLRISVGTAEIAGREIGIASWNFPLTRAGLSVGQESRLGEYIGREFTTQGITI